MRAGQGRSSIPTLIQALELQCLVEIAETIVVSALGREESRGAHYRADFPNAKRYNLASPQPETVDNQTGRS